jgi:hypothetical protein
MINEDDSGGGWDKKRKFCSIVTLLDNYIDKNKKRNRHVGDNSP